MSKTLTIDTAAAWAASITAPQDGDVNSEAGLWDAVMDSIGDRLGYLKATVDNSLRLSGPLQAVSGTVEFENSVSFGSDVFLNGTVEIQNLGGSFTVDCDASFNGQLSFGTTAGAGPRYRTVSISATSTISDGYDFVNVGAIAANITLTIPTGEDGQKIRISRKRTGDAFTVTLNRPDAHTMGVISASSAGWLEVCRQGSEWLLVGWGGTVTSLTTTY